MHLACSIIWIWLEGNISSPVEYSYLPILPDENAYIFAASLLILYCSFSSLILSSIALISFYILSKRLFLQLKGLSIARVVSTTINIWPCSTLIINIFKVFRVNIQWRIKSDLLKLSFVLNFHNKKHVQFSLTSSGTGKQQKYLIFFF